MVDRGGVFKRCGCTNRAIRRRLDLACPRLTERGHGTWYFRCSTLNALGRAERVRRGGYPTRAAAQRAREEWPCRTAEERTVQSWTLERWLRYWPVHPYRNTAHNEAVTHRLRRAVSHPAPRQGPPGGPDLRHLNAALTEIGKTHNRFGRPHSACTLSHVRTTLRAALNAAIREELITDNPARRVEIPTRIRPHAVVWSRPRIAEWHATGARPPWRCGPRRCWPSSPSRRNRPAVRALVAHRPARTAPR